jgi:hypothetical protein
MDHVPVMSHRQVLRQRMNAEFQVPSFMGPIIQPYQAGTRYRRKAFSIKDISKILEIKSLPNGTHRKVLVVAGHTEPRQMDPCTREIGTNS